MCDVTFKRFRLVPINANRTRRREEGRQDIGSAGGELAALVESRHKLDQRVRELNALPGLAVARFREAARQ